MNPRGAKSVPTKSHIWSIAWHGCLCRCRRQLREEHSGFHSPHDTETRPGSSAYTAAMFSETRYALNGDLRVAYRTSSEGPRDIVFVPNWFTCCEVIPELQSMQGWIEAMTSLGRLIFFDQPGTGASDPVTPGALPTLEQWADSITAVLDDLGSREAILVAIDGAVAAGRYSPRCIRPVPPRWSCLRATRIGRPHTSVDVAVDERRLPCGAPASCNISSIRTCHGMRRSGPPGHEWNVWRQAPRTVALILPLVPEMDVRAVLPTVRVPTLVVHHADDPLIPPERASMSPTTYPVRSTSSFRAATCTTSLNRGGIPSRRSPSSSLASRLTWPMIGFWPRCCSPTSWTRRAEPRRSATVTGMRCSMRTTPSYERNSLGFEAAR